MSSDDEMRSTNSTPNKPPPSERRPPSVGNEDDEMRTSQNRPPAAERRRPPSTDDEPTDRELLLSLVKDIREIRLDITNIINKVDAWDGKIQTLEKQTKANTTKLKTRDCDEETQRRLTSTSTLSPLNQSTGISFTDLLLKMKSHYEKEQDLATSPPTITVKNTKTVQASKVNGTISGASSVSSVSKAPAGTTLEKLLSSNNGNSASHSLEETAVYNHSSVSNYSAGSEKNLSLANLLASSKSRDEPQKKKSDAANVPVCQGCHSNKAQFVCAGCANQWYCSRECQVAAWDEHAEVCSG